MIESFERVRLNFVDQNPTKEIALANIRNAKLLECFPFNDLFDVVGLGQMLLERGKAD